jgi:uncharacterized protein YaiI (UPF0178 family)
MHIWVDADACPAEAKEVLFRSAERTGIYTVLVANQPMRIPYSDVIDFKLVKAGPDVADQWIVDQVQPEDLVVSADIPLAAKAIEKQAFVLDPRGEMLTPQNIGSRLANRNFLDQLRGTGLMTGGPPPYNRRDKQAFANALDRFLNSQRRK